MRFFVCFELNQNGMQLSHPTQTWSTFISSMLYLLGSYLTGTTKSRSIKKQHKLGALVFIKIWYLWIQSLMKQPNSTCQHNSFDSQPYTPLLGSQNAMCTLCPCAFDSHSFQYGKFSSKLSNIPKRDSSVDVNATPLLPLPSPPDLQRM